MRSPEIALKRSWGCPCALRDTEHIAARKRDLNAFTALLSDRGRANTEEE